MGQSEGRSEAPPGDPAPDAAEALVPVPVLIGRVGREVSALHGRCAALEARLGAALPAETRLNPDLREALQSLDHLTQATAGLAAFLDGLGAAATAGAVDPRALTGRIALRAVASRLAEGVDAPPTQARGAVELF